MVHWRWRWKAYRRCNILESVIAPTGSKYKTDDEGAGGAEFPFDQGYGYNVTVGKTIVIHDTTDDLNGDYVHVFCDLLEGVWNRQQLLIHDQAQIIVVYIL